ncbi:unnamed protein product, partial [Effrenium voratum]
MGEKERIDMKVCWKYTPAMGESGPVPRHVAQVGTLTLLDPNSMSDCLVSLTSLVKKQTTPYAPLIISFRTATAETGKRYESLEGRMRLRIYFVRTVALKATFTDGATIEENQGEDELVEARQYICGKLFREVWSSDDQLGFPMPRGCYYRTYGQTQELNVLFDRKNGLAPGKYYQVVLSGVAMDEAMRNGEYVHIFTTDDVDVNPYISLERGVAPLYRSPQDAAYGSQGVKFAETEGVKISSGSGTEMLELKGGTELRLTLRGDPLGGGISASAILRLYLWPLTQWNVANACTVSCIPHDQVSAPCGAVQDCKGDAIIPNFQQNYLRIVLPSAMATMTEFVSHTLVFPDLVLPPGGFFSTRLAAQISKPDDTKPHYTESSGDYLYKMPDEGVGVGKLVEFYGDGDQRPFRGDMQNVLYASIVLPATLFAAVQTADAYLTLTLPSGYSCVRTPDVNGDSPWRAEDTLGVFQDAIPQGTGSPDEGSGTRGWSVTDNHCVYTLRQNAVVYAGSSLYIRVTVNNPEQALQRMDPANRWQVTMTSKGYHQYFVSFPPVIFNTIIANFSSNTAVLGKIEQPLIVPSNWMFSEGGVVMSQGYLNIFFRSEQGTGVMASVHVEAPPGFTFTPNPCEVSDLEDMYYATPGQMGSPTHRLPGFVSCEHRMYPYNHAAIKLTGAILANSYYAFGLWCSNAEAYLSSQRTGWRIFTLDMNDYRVDGTALPIPVIAHTATSLPMSSDSTQLSFGLYRAQLNTQTTLNVQATLMNVIPYSMSRMRTTVTVLPLQVVETISSTLRVISPMGYDWDFQNSEFRHLAPFPNTTESLWVQGTNANLPGGYPLQQGNVLLWNQERMYLSNETYGFQTYLRVPDRSPTASPNAFIFEFGYEGTSLATRHAASMVPVSLVRSLSNAQLEYITNVETKVNTVIFQVQTVSQVPMGGGMVIQGPLGFEFPDACQPEAAPMARGSTYQVQPMVSKVMSLPDDVVCSFQMGAAPMGRATIRLAAASGIPPGLYRFQILGKNPSAVMPNPADANTPCRFQHCWDFHSLQDINNLDSRLDAMISVPSFPINAKMVEALMPTLTREQQAATGRDDRPYSRNPLVFSFKLGSTVLFRGEMLIRAPLGTIFREDCGEDVEVRPTEVFGTGQMLPAEYGQWPQGVDIVSCRGEGPDARIIIDPGVTDGLQNEVFFPIRIAPLHNPIQQPADNQWTLDFNGESSDPFPGYMLWTFTRTSLLTATTGRSTTVTGEAFFVNPVTITFRPKNTVKGAGMIIQVRAPPSWQIAREADGQCKTLAEAKPLELELKVKEELGWDRHCAQGLQEGYSIAEDLPFCRTLDHDNAEERPYKSRKGESKTVLHWGQRKLILAEIEFLSRYYSSARCVVYAGAAPGTHIGFLAKMFPKLHFELVDCRPFSRKLEAEAKEMEEAAGKERICMRQELFTNTLAKAYATREGVLFISDVRTSKDDEFHPSQQAVEEDMKLQMEWHCLMRPLASSFKFRLPWCAGTTRYLNGSIFLPVWGPETTTESRLFVETGGPEEAAEQLKTYDNQKYERQMFYFNTHRRIAKYKHSHADYFRCSCFDCTSEAMILEGYFKAVQPTPEPVEAAAQDVPSLSRWLHKECHRYLAIGCGLFTLPNNRKVSVSSTIAGKDFVDDLSRFHSAVLQLKVKALGEKLLACSVSLPEVDTVERRTLTATVLASEREITANRDYQLTIFVRNPTLTIRPYEENPTNVWQLDTFDSPSSSGVLPTYRDSITLPGYPVQNKARQWVVRNQDPLTGVEYRNGLSEVPGLFMQFQLPTKLIPGDVITIQAPMGFSFSAAGDDTCPNFRWEPMEDAYLYLPNSLITCTGTMLTMDVREPKNVEELRTMMFRLDSRNPAKTPHVMLNQWSITHTSNGVIMSTEATNSWDVVPQLANVRVMLVGRQKAENSVSTIAVSYRPVSDADELTLQALEPTGFDFTGATAVSLGHEVIATSAETIRIRASMYADVNVDIVIANFRLGLNGGATLFNLITKLNNGEQMDEALTFRQGFRLPGRVVVTGKQISSEYKLMPELYPVPSLWEVRMGEDALVEMPFTVTVNSALGDMMRVRAPPYDLKAEDFNIIQSGTAEIVTSEVISASSGELVARLSTQLFRGVLYEVRVKVLTPKVPNPSDAMWTIEDTAFGDQGFCKGNFDIAEIKEDTAFSNPQKWVDAHNHYRWCHGLPGLSWAPELLPYAKAWVTQLLQHCASGADLEAWAGAGNGRPHDPGLFTTEKPEQAENIDVRQFNSINDPEAASVEAWYREVSGCPKAGWEPGCGGQLNHYTALIWRDAKRVACYVGLRADLRVVSCRYAAAGSQGTGCEVPNTVGPPGSEGCQLGAGVPGHLPEVPALIHTCPPAAGAAPAPPPPPQPVPATAAAPAAGKGSCVEHSCMVSCINRGQLGTCERCLTSEQCGGDLFCCPFMKKCVANGGQQCMTPIAFCQPPCMDSVPLDQCKCNPKYSKDVFPGEWQKPTCKDGEVAHAVTTTPKPTSPPTKLVYSGIKDLNQWNRLFGFLKDKLKTLKVKRMCSSIEATTPSPDQQTTFLKANGMIFLKFYDMSSVTPQTAAFEGITPAATPISDSELDQMCSATQRLWSLAPAEVAAAKPFTQILDGNPLSLNTNDGLTEGFRLVDRAELTVRASRSPPMAEIDVDLVVDPKSSQPDELILVAPLGFNFTTNCLVASQNNDVLSCRLFGNVAGRAAALLTTVRLTSILEYVVIKVRAPAQNPPSTSWFVNARDSATGLQLAWGEDPQGVLIRQMLGASVLYPGIPSIAGQMAFSFITNEKIEEGGAIRVGYPTDIEILCAGQYLYQVAIAGEVTCINYIQQGYFELRLTRPLPPGQQAFAVTSTCPAAVNDNYFYIVILTDRGQVSDAAMSIPGLRIQHGLPISAMPLIWGMAEPNRNTFVSTGIEILGELPLKDPPIISEIIIQMPPDFSHQVQKTAQLETLTQPLPRRDGGWLDVTDPRRLRLLMDEEAIQKLAIGAYRFQWPIMVPAVMPKYNIWELTVCSPALRNESCTGSNDPR